MTLSYRSSRYITLGHFKNILTSLQRADKQKWYLQNISFCRWRLPGENRHGENLYPIHIKYLMKGILL